MTNTLYLLVFLLTPFYSLSQSWVGTTAPVSGDRYDDIYFHSPDTGWAVRGDGSIFKTVDAGANWSLQFNAPNRYFRSVDFINANVGFAGTLDSGLYKTTDGGSTWFEIQHLIPTPIPGICGLSHFGNNVYGVGLFANPAYFIKSTDQGNTWTFTDLSLLADGLVECHFLDANTGFISGVGENNGAVILKTIDGGNTWTEVFNSQSGTQYVWKLDFINNQLAYGAIEAFSGPAKIVKTTDGGNNWTVHTVSPTYMDLQGIGFKDADTGWVGPRLNPMYVTHNGGLNWQVDSNLYQGVNRFFRWDSGLLYASGTGIYKYGTGPNATQEFYAEEFHSIEKLFPNPIQNHFKFEVNIGRNTTARLDLYTLNGKQVANFHQGRLYKGKHFFELSEKECSQLPAGNYLLVLRTNEGFISEKLIKL